MLGNVWMSWYGTSFYLERDKKAIFLSRILVSLKISYFLDMFKQMRRTILDIPKEHTHTHLKEDIWTLSLSSETG